MKGTNGNGRYSGDSGYQQLMSEAGMGLGRVLSERQRYAVTLSLQIFAYLMTTIESDQVSVSDVIGLLKLYNRGINNAKSEP
jgi:hypothetical protein